MSTKCALCGRTVRSGSNVSHSKVHTKRRWNPNIHPATILVKNQLVHANLCTRCIRSQKKVTS